MSSVPNATAQFLVRQALLKLGMINAHDPVTDPADMTQGLTALWFMLDEWNGQDQMIPYITQVEFSVQDDKRIYLYGSGGDFDSPRPLNILNARWRDAVGAEYPINIVGNQLWADGNPSKSTSQGRPYQMWWNQSYPTSQIYLEYFPMATDTLVLQVLLPFSAETCACCDGSECDTGCVDADCSGGSVDPDDFTITVAGCPDGDDACVLSGTTQMETYLAAQCSTDCSTTYEQDFTYDPGTGDITITATAVPTPRTSMRPTQLSLTEQTEFPPAYQATIIWNLAECLAPEYGMEASPTIQRKAKQMRDYMKKRNNRGNELIVDNALTSPTSWYNIYSGSTQIN